MADYLELNTLYTSSDNNDLVNKAKVAAGVAAYNLISAGGANADQVRLGWSILLSPARAGQILLLYVLAANKGLTVAQILAATDDQIQTRFDEAAAALAAAQVVL